MTLPIAHLPMPLIDSHCHLDVSQFDEDRPAVLASAKAVGLKTIINPGIDLTHCRQAIALAEAHEAVYAAVGIHPTSSGDFDTTTIGALRALAAHPKVVAIGEIGLDYYWDTVDPAQQAKAFQLQLDLAAEVGLPVIIHNRDATADTVKTLSAWAVELQKNNSPLLAKPFWGVLHAFGGALELAHQAYDWNFVLGLGGPVTFRNARQLHEVAAKLDLTRLMLETDAPYLTPHPYRGKRNEPAYVALVCEQLATLRGCSPQEIAAQTSAVATKFFGLNM